MSEQQQSETTARESKRAQFAEPSGSGSKPIIAIVVVGLVVVAAAVYFALGQKGDGTIVVTEAAPPAGSTQPPPGEFRMSVNDVRGPKAKFYDFTLANSQKIRFFVVKTSEGDYRAALDACEVCAHAKQGYEQQADDMVCRNCGKRFATALIGKIQGGCHPIALNMKTDGNEFVINKSELEAGAKYF
jgi:uncharacterized membrane protein